MPIKSKFFHNRKNECLEIYSKLCVDGSLSKYEKLISEYSNQPHLETEEQRNKFKGDMWEIFAELYFSILGPMLYVAVKNYTPNNGIDYGVDGSATHSSKGHVIVIQVKYRSNPADKIIYEDLAKTVAQGGSRHYDFNWADRPESLICFSNSGANYCAHDAFKDTLIDIDRSFLKRTVNGNSGFWENCKYIVESQE